MVQQEKDNFIFPDILYNLLMPEFINAREIKNAEGIVHCASW